MNFSIILKKHQDWLNGDKHGERADFSDADLSYKDFHGVDLRRANLHGANLRGADLRGANLSSSNLGNVILRGADLSSADLTNVAMYHADLRNADLVGANLSGANLGVANIHGANFRGANLSRTNLHGAYISYSDLCGTTMDGCTLPNGKKYEEWLPSIQEWLEVPKVQIYGWPDGSRVSIKFVPSYPSFGIEFEMIPKIGQERFFWNYSRGPTGPVDPHSKISRVFFDMGLIEESAAEEGAWICPTSEEIELRRLLDEPHPLLLPFEELREWMLSAGERR